MYYINLLYQIYYQICKVTPYRFTFLIKNCVIILITYLTNYMSSKK